jgi:hypothetical protein
MKLAAGHATGRFAMLRGQMIRSLRMPASASDPTAAVTASGDAAAAEASPATPQSFAVGQMVRLTQRPRYLKSADPMPMLRPPDLVDDQEVGVVMELRPQGHYAVRFRRGTYLIAGGLLESAVGEGAAG